MSDFMKLALDQARQAQAQDEVPIGAVIVKDGQVIATAHNLSERLKDPTAHAELLAIRAASQNLGGVSKSMLKERQVRI